MNRSVIEEEFILAQKIQDFCDLKSLVPVSKNAMIRREKMIDEACTSRVQ